MKKTKSMVMGAAILAALALPMVAGAANKLVVNGTDGVTPVMAVTDTGAVGAGTANPQAQFDVSKTWSGVSAINFISAFTSYGDVSRLTIRTAKGTAASPTQLLNGNPVGNINFRGHDGTNFSNMALSAIAVNAEGDFTSTSQPTRMVFLTSPTGSAVGLERLRLASDGRLRLSNQPSAPANNATCTAGDLILDAAGGYLYLCTATNSWKRAAFGSY